MIDSPTNPTIKAVRKLHQRKHRKAEGRTILEGSNGREAIASTEVQPELLLVTPDDVATQSIAADRGLAVTLVSQRALEAASDTQQAMSPVAVIAIPPPRAVRTHPTVALIDVADPGNVGTIIRTALAFGFDVAVYGTTADPWSPKAIRSSAGATLRVHVAIGTDVIGDAQESGLETVALVVNGGEAIPVSDRPPMLLVGSEAHGLPPTVIERADTAATIKTADVESLNAATAAAIAMYASTCQSGNL